MKLSAATHHLQRVCSARANDTAAPSELSAALAAASRLRAFLAASEANLARRLAATSPFPEGAVADSTRDTTRNAAATLERGETLSHTPGLANAFDNAAVTSAHIDAVTRAAKSLEGDDQRSTLFERVDELTNVANTVTASQFNRRVKHLAAQIAADAGVARLERQRRATSMRTWVDLDGMWNIRGQFDPVSALSISAALDRAVEQMFAEPAPATCPSDPIEKQNHLRALAFARLVTGRGAGSGSGSPGPTGPAPLGGRGPEFVAVIDVAPHAPSSAGAEPTDSNLGNGTVSVEWPLPIEVPRPVLAELARDAKVTTVVVDNGVVLHAPGTLNLGRSTRLANAAQRRALRGLYRHCALPGCTVAYRHCKLHHIRWWRHGGATDLENLLPVCSRHHHNIHDNGWEVHLDDHRRLTLTLPDGSIRNTGPPRRSAA